MRQNAEEFLLARPEPFHRQQIYIIRAVVCGSGLAIVYCRILHGTATPFFSKTSRLRSPNSGSYDQIRCCDGPSQQPMRCVSTSTNFIPASNVAEEDFLKIVRLSSRSHYSSITRIEHSFHSSRYLNKFSNTFQFYIKFISILRSC